MKFEHLVEINDSDSPLLFNLNREQIWSGLMQRVEDARAFLPGLDECVIRQRGPNSVKRLLRWGQVELHDEVHWEPALWVRFDTPPSETHGGGTLTIRIEEPEAERYFLRFSYDTAYAQGHEVEDEAYATYLRQAYEAADIDTVHMIRLLAEAVRVH